MKSDLEISKALALAIGWEEDQMCEYMFHLYVADWPNKENRKSVLLNTQCYPPPFLPWKRFDYRDPCVIWPIAEKYDCFPARYYDDGLPWGSAVTFQTHFADTAAKAVALAVIGAKK